MKRDEKTMNEILRPDDVIVSMLHFKDYILVATKRNILRVDEDGTIGQVKFKVTKGRK